uniref:Tumor necrosis factor ligand superfamily member 12 n=1 Tax=Pogona vitticeps TaxID=103695 RepID=A0ABM5GQB7_9SAUR
MGRRRRAREPPARLVLLALALASGSALLLASLSLLLAAWPRSSARAHHQEAAAAAAAAGPQELLSEEEVEDLDQVALSTSWNSQGKFLHHLAQQGALRQRRQASAKGKRARPRRPSAVSAAHYEVQSSEGRAGIQADANGTIHGWAEANLNTTSPLRYDRSRKEFTVVKRGLYYLYCQVHFNEGKTIYMKLDVMLDDQLALRCLEEFSPTSSGPQEPELKVCQVSGLVLLAPGESIRLRTIPKVRLKADRYLTYFGLFQVHPAWPPDPAPSSASPLGSLDAAEVLPLNVDGLESGGRDQTEAYLDIETALPGAAGRRQENTEQEETEGPDSWGVFYLSFFANVEEREVCSGVHWGVRRDRWVGGGTLRGASQGMQLGKGGCQAGRGWIQKLDLLSCPAKEEGGRAQDARAPSPSTGSRNRLGGGEGTHAFGASCSRQKLQGGQNRRLRTLGTPARPRRGGIGGVLSPAAFPGPMAKSGSRPGLDREPPSLLATLWVGACALGVGLLACLFTLASLQSRLEMLHEELSLLRGELKVEADARGKPEALQSPSEFVVPPLLHPRPPTFLERKRRDAAKTSHRQGRQRRKQSVLHLVPVRHHSNDEGDSTEIWWEPFLHQGGALVPSGQEVLVKHTGLYFIYSQVLFHDPMFTMGQVLMRMPVGKPDQILFRCVQSMPSDPEKAYNSCYSGGIFHLHQGDRLNLRIPRFNASFDASAHGTFLGLLRL